MTVQSKGNSEFIICKLCTGWHEKGDWCQDDYFKGMEIVMP